MRYAIAIIAGIAIGAGVVWYLMLLSDKHNLPTVTTGRLVIHPNIAGNGLEPRSIRVWLPDGFVDGDSCDVLYMHDILREMNPVNFREFP